MGLSKELIMLSPMYMMFKQDHSSILFIKLIQDMSNGKVINRSQSGCKSSYIDTIDLKKSST